MASPGCRTVNIEGMRVPVDYVMIELRLPVGGLHAGEMVGWEPSQAAVVDAKEIGDSGFRITQSDMYGLPRAENVEDWENTEASLKVRLGPEYDRLTDFEKEVLLRGTPLGHGRYTFLLKVESAGKIRGPEVTVADLKKLGRFSPRAHVYADPVSGDRVSRTYLPTGEQLDYRNVLGTPVAFDAKKARGAAGRPGKHPGKVWDAARANPEALVMLLEGISPGSSDKTARSRGTRRANAQQMAWILQTPGAAHCVSGVLTRANEALDNWVTDGRHFENGFERYVTQDRDLDKALRLIRGFADLSETDPDVLTGFLEGRTPERSEALQRALAESSRFDVLPGATDASLARGVARHLSGLTKVGRRIRPIDTWAGASTHLADTGQSLLVVAAALGYISTQQAENISGAAALAALAQGSGESPDEAVLPESHHPSDPHVKASAGDALLVGKGYDPGSLWSGPAGEQTPVEGKTAFLRRVLEERGMEATYVAWTGNPEQATNPGLVTSPDGVTRPEMMPLPDTLTREPLAHRRLMRIDVRRSKFAANGDYDGDTVRFELLGEMVVLTCPWDDDDLLVRKAGPDADVDVFIRELLDKVKTGHATLTDARTGEDLDPEKTLARMVLGMRVGSMNVENALINNALKRFGVDPVALQNKAAEAIRENPSLMDEQAIYERWRNASDSAAPRVPSSFLSTQLPILKSLELPIGRAAASGSLVFVGVPGIEPDDIDILCDRETWDAYSQDPRAVWRTTKTGTRVFSIADAEFFTDLPGMLSPSAPTIGEALATSEVRWGVPFLSVACMRAWKLRAGRTKDLTHVRLVDDFLGRGGVIPGH